jgi:hypothetical protein
MHEENELLFRLYQEEWIQCRHHQDLRSKMTGLVVAITAGLTAVVSSVNLMSQNDIPLAILLIAIGILAPIFSMKQHERFSFHLDRARQYRDKIDNNIEELSLRDLRCAAKKVSQKKHPYLFDLRLKYFWATMNALPIFVGIVILFLILCPMKA